MAILALIIDYIIRILMLVVIVHVVLSYFMDPYHPVRRTLSSWVEPLLAPVRRVIPPIGMIDLSPLVLILILQVLNIIIRRILL